MRDTSHISERCQGAASIVHRGIGGTVHRQFVQRWFAQHGRIKDNHLLDDGGKARRGFLWYLL
jgi:hypothetical protein